METQKHQALRRRLDSATVWQLAFPWESNSNCPWEESQWDNTVVPKKKKKSFCSLCLVPSVTVEDATINSVGFLVHGFVYTEEEEEEEEEEEGVERVSFSTALFASLL